MIGTRFAWPPPSTARRMASVWVRRAMAQPTYIDIRCLRERALRRVLRFRVRFCAGSLRTGGRAGLNH